MKTALLISTYNWPEALGVVLQSLSRQTRFPAEVLIADDGSREETKILIDKFKGSVPFPVTHFWQEDKGFRKSVILNKALAATNADYIIQVDGDCIMHPNFIEDHLSSAAKNVYIFGSRVNIKPHAVDRVLKEKFREFSFYSKAIKNKTRNIRIPFLQKIYKPQPTFSHKTRGCNISFWREDFIAVNGYNESIEGWGREDSELFLRMLNKGVQGKRLRYGGIVYHIYHPEKSKDNLPENTRIQEETMRENKIWCAQGIDKHLAKPV